MEQKKRFGYDGVVTQFGSIINRNWNAETAATSEKKAMSNLKYRYKKDYNLLPSSKIELPGELYLIEE